MIKNKKLWEEFNKEWILKRKISLKRRVKIYDGLYELAKELEVFPLKNPLQGIEHILRMAKILNYNYKNKANDKKVVIRVTKILEENKIPYMVIGRYER